MNNIIPLNINVSSAEDYANYKNPNMHKSINLDYVEGIKHEIECDDCDVLRNVNLVIDILNKKSVLDIHSILRIVIDQVNDSTNNMK
jgi:hypothetical protein